MLHLAVIALFPEILNGLDYGVIGRAMEQKLVKLDCWSLRDWSTGPYRQVDDKPYGGGPGMVLMYEPLKKAIAHAKTQMPASCRTIYLSPQGKRVSQHKIIEVAKTKQALLFIAGRYEGIDERVIEHHVDEEWSLGDFVLSGGELAAMAIIDAIVRLLPGCLGHCHSANQDSFMQGLLDHPQYTRPAVIDGMAVPPVLLSGHRREIERWQQKQRLGKTWLKRPDLLNEQHLTPLDMELLNEFKQSHALENDSFERSNDEQPY